MSRTQTYTCDFCGREAKAHRQDHPRDMYAFVKCSRRDDSHHNARYSFEIRERSPSYDSHICSHCVEELRVCFTEPSVFSLLKKLKPTRLKKSS